MDDDAFVIESETRIIDAATGEDCTHVFADPSYCRCGDPRVYRQVIIPLGIGKTQQHFAEGTEIDVIYARCMREGITFLDVGDPDSGQYGDCSNLQGLSLTELIEQTRSTDEIVSDFAEGWEPKAPEAPVVAPEQVQAPPA